MITWIKEMFSKALRVFNAMLKSLFDAGIKVIMAELYNVALESVKRLATTDLANEQKRQQAFNDIKSYAIQRGLSVSSHLINFQNLPEKALCALFRPDSLIFFLSFIFINRASNFLTKKQ